MTCSPATGANCAPTGAAHGENQMNKLESFLAYACMLALLVCSGCSANNDAAPSNAPATQTNRSTKANPAATPKNSAQKDSAATETADLPPAAQRGTLLQRLPKTTLFALRFPHVEKLETAFERSSLYKLFSAPALAPQREQMEEGIETMLAEASKNIPDFDELKEQVMSLEGEVVFAVLSVDGAAFSRGSDQIDGFPLTVAFMFDAGSHAGDVDALVQRIATL